MKRRVLVFLLSFCLIITMFTAVASASAHNIEIPEIDYYENSGDVAGLTVNFDWDTASATSRIVVMTERLRSAGESGTDKYYGDFTDYGYYGRSFKSWNAVLSASDTFGMLYYTDEQKISMGRSHSISVTFDEGDIPLDVNETYYLYLWTYYGGYYYPDNLFMVLQVKDGKFQYAAATDRNSYGSFETLWELEDAPSAPPAPSKPAAPNFTDVKSDAYYAAPVDWAVSKGITNGTSATTFSPDQTCTRAHILTFLWRSAGSPDPGISNPYSDVKSGDWFYKAALWANEKGIYKPSGKTFAPNTACTRGSTVEYFWKYANSKSVENVPFSDIAAGTDLGKAVSWAVDYGITNGTGGTSFSPDKICTRGQIVTFLHRYFVKPLDNSALIKDLKAEAKKAATEYTGKLDPLPPVDYTKQPDWYGTLTPSDRMSNARLVAEYEQICKVIEERQAKGQYLSDGPYSRELDLWSALSQRCDVVERYDRGVRNGSPAQWIVDAYNELVAAYGDAEVLRLCDLYSN